MKHVSNGLANLHNASRAHVPIINIIGQHATYYLRHDTPLVSDIEGIARPYTNWLRTAGSASGLGGDAVEAIKGARSAPGQIATLIVTADVAWSEGGIVARASCLTPVSNANNRNHRQSSLDALVGIANGNLIDGNALYGSGLSTAGRIAAATGAKLLAPGSRRSSAARRRHSKGRLSSVCPRTGSRTV